MASGLPVVLARDPSYGAALAGAGPGARVVDAEPGALAAELTGLLADAAARAAAAEAAASHARAAFSWAAAVDAHERLYAELRAGALGA
jgi:glycosyltransferase involved in cell wall biosynthesis